MYKIKPVFTIVTVCRNNLLGLQETETSVRSQDYDHFEWLVIDGASSDGTQDYLSSLKYPFLKWWSESDRSHFDAMNKGIERSQGEYLLFLNAGDRLFDSCVLSKVAKAPEQGTHDAWLIGDVMDLLEGGILIHKKARPLGYLLHSLPSSHQAIFFHRGAIGEVRYNGDDYPISGDYAFAAEIFCSGHRTVKYLGFPVCIFSLGGISSRNRSGLLHDAWMVQKEILDIKLPFRLISYLYRLISMYLLDNFASLYRWFRNIADKFTILKDKEK